MLVPEVVGVDAGDQEGGDADAVGEQQVLVMFRNSVVVSRELA